MKLASPQLYIHSIPFLPKSRAAILQQGGERGREEEEVEEGKRRRRRKVRKRKAYKASLYF